MFFDGIVVAATDCLFIKNLATLSNRPHALLLDYTNTNLDEQLVGRLSQYILCTNKQGDDFCGSCDSCKAWKLNMHPDFLLLQAEEKVNKVIKIEQIKQVVASFQYAPSISSLRVCVIQDANLMNPESSNALLKVLEEPPGECLFILTCNNFEKILPTIRSRLISWRMKKPKENDILDQLIDLEIADGQKQALLKLSNYDLNKIKLMAEPNLQETRQYAWDFIQYLCSRQLLHAFLQTDTSRSRWKEMSERNNFQWFVFFLTYYLRDILLVQNNCSELVYNLDKASMIQEKSEQLDPANIEKMLNMLADYEKMFALNINNKMLLDNLFIQFM